MLPVTAADDGKSFESEGRPGYFAEVPQVLSFFGFYLWQLLLANLHVGYDIVTPTHYMRPGVIGVPLDAQTDFEILLLTYLITLTPGTLCLDVSPDRRTMYGRCMYIDGDDLEAARREIKEGLERRVLQVLRR